MPEYYKVGAVGVYDKSNDAALRGQWFMIVNVNENARPRARG